MRARTPPRLELGLGASVTSTHISAKQFCANRGLCFYLNLCFVVEFDMRGVTPVPCSHHTVGVLAQTQKVIRQLDKPLWCSRMPAKKAAASKAPPAKRGGGAASSSPPAKKAATIKAAAHVKPEPPPVVEDLVKDNFNTHHFGTVSEALATLSSNPVFASMKDDEPLTIDKNADLADQGNKSAFDVSEFKIVMADPHGVYESGCNLMWLNLFKLAVTGVPINTGQVQRLQDHFFKSPPSNFPMTLTVAVGTAEDVLTTKGSWLLLSPLELVHALLLSAAEACTLGVDHAELKQWRRLILGTTFAFEAIDNADDRHWRSVQLREQMGAKHAGMSRTPLARAYEVIAYKARCETTSGTLTPEMMEEIYAKRGELNELSEKVTKSFIDAAVTVHARALSIPAVQQLLTGMERHYGIKTPISSIYTLDAIVKRVDSDECIEWAIASLLHQVEESHLLITDLSVRNLTGKGQGGKGLIDLACLRRRFLRFLAFTYVEKHPFDLETKVAMRKMLDHSVYYTMFGMKNAKVDISWISLLPLSGQNLLRLAEVSSNPNLEWINLPTGFLRQWLHP
jgi:hypothetical protein